MHRHAGRNLFKVRGGGILPGSEVGAGQADVVERRFVLCPVCDGIFGGRGVTGLMCHPLATPLHVHPVQGSPALVSPAGRSLFSAVVVCEGKARLEKRISHELVASHKQSKLQTVDFLVSIYYQSEPFLFLSCLFALYFKCLFITGERVIACDQKFPII